MLLIWTQNYFLWFKVYLTILFFLNFKLILHFAYWFTPNNTFVLFTSIFILNYIETMDFNFNTSVTKQQYGLMHTVMIKKEWNSNNWRKTYDLEVMMALGILTKNFWHFPDRTEFPIYQKFPPKKGLSNT